MKGLSWTLAMNEVQVQRLIQKYKQTGELESEDPALVILKRWPASKKYKDNPDKLPGLEKVVCRFYKYKIDLLEMQALVAREWC